MEFEIWKTNPEYPTYEFSNLGRIKNINRKKCVKGQVDKDGYLRLMIYDKNMHQRWV